MELLGWILAAVFALLSLVLARTRASESASGRAEPSKAPNPVVESEGRTREAPEATAAALRGMARYLDNAVSAPLEEALRTGELRSAAEDALDAVRDLSAYGGGGADEAERKQNLVPVLESVVEEYTLATGITIELSGHEQPQQVRLAAERFKDALYSILSNADRFGGGGTVDVLVDRRGRDVEVRIRDRGPGFTAEALQKAFEPFWSSEDDALGLGLTHAKKLVEEQGGRLTVGNAREGGAESVVSLPLEP